MSLHHAVVEQLETVVESAVPFKYESSERFSEETATLVYMWLYAPRWPVPNDQSEFSALECSAIASFKQAYGQFVARTLPDLRVGESEMHEQWQLVQGQARAVLNVLSRSRGAD